MTPGRPSPRVLTVTAPPEHPDADLLAWEAELDHLVVEHARLEASWPKGKTAVERARTGRRLDEVLTRTAELHGLIARTRPRTPASAAVQLRRALAAIEAHDCKSPFANPERIEARLVEAALGVVESAKLLVKQHGEEARVSCRHSRCLALSLRQPTSASRKCRVERC